MSDGRLWWAQHLIARVHVIERTLVQQVSGAHTLNMRSEELAELVKAGIAKLPDQERLIIQARFGTGGREIDRAVDSHHKIGL